MLRLFALNFLNFVRNANKSLAESEQFYEGLLVYRAARSLVQYLIPSCMFTRVSFDFLNVVRKK